MNFRMAKMDDLPQLKVVYKKIIEEMNYNNIDIWDEIYPCEFFKEDIENKRLYLLEKNNTIVSAFALCKSNAGAKHLKWEKEEAEVLYIDRLGVNVDYLKQGIGGIMLEKAVELAKENGVEYLRLFVVDINQPAINLYIKNGFKRAEGIYDEIIDDNLTLHEYGFEKQVLTCKYDLGDEEKC